MKQNNKLHRSKSPQKGSGFTPTDGPFGYGEQFVFPLSPCYKNTPVKTLHRGGNFLDDFKDLFSGKKVKKTEKSRSPSPSLKHKKVKKTAKPKSRSRSPSPKPKKVKKTVKSKSPHPKSKKTVKSKSPSPKAKKTVKPKKMTKKYMVS
jgi:hypothetical protein